MVCQPDKRGQKAESERWHHQSDLMINLIWWSVWSDVQKNHLKLFLSPSSFTSQPLLANPAWLGFGRIVIVVRSPYYACVNWICFSYSCFRFAMFTLSRHCIFFLYFDLCFCIFFSFSYFIFPLRCVVLWLCTDPTLIWWDAHWVFLCIIIIAIIIVF